MPILEDNFSSNQTQTVLTQAYSLKSPKSLTKTLVMFSKQCPAAAESSEAKFIHPKKSGDFDVVVVQGRDLEDCGGGGGFGFLMQ